MNDELEYGENVWYSILLLIIVVTLLCVLQHFNIYP